VIFFTKIIVLSYKKKKKESKHRFIAGGRFLTSFWFALSVGLLFPTTEPWRLLEIHQTTLSG